MLKVIVKTYIVRKYFNFEQMLLFLTLYFKKKSKKIVSHVPKNNIKQHNTFNTHNKSAYYYDF